MDIGMVKLVLLAGCWVSIKAMTEFWFTKVALQTEEIIARSSWEHSGVDDTIACALACIKDARCKTLIYSNSQETCWGYRLKFNSHKAYGSVTDVHGGDNIVLEIYRAKTQHGRLCRHNDECSTQDSVCHHGVCLCRPGLYFSPTQNTCLRNCDEYGEKMDVYMGLTIVGQNTARMFGVSLARCIEECVKKTTFTCLTVDWNMLGANECFLSRAGYLDVSERQRENTETQWKLAQRQCK